MGLISFLLSMTEGLLGKFNVMVGIQIYCCEVQVATVWFVREIKQNMAFFVCLLVCFGFYVCLFVATLGSKWYHHHLEKKCLLNLIILLLILFCRLFLTESGWIWKCLGTLFPLSYFKLWQLSSDWRFSHHFYVAAIMGYFKWS